jgi:hypothetical protein
MERNICTGSFRPTPRGSTQVTSVPDLVCITDLQDPFPTDTVAPKMPKFFPVRVIL